MSSMTGNTHLAMGAATSCFLATKMNIDLTIVNTNIAFISGAVAGLLPDIDHVNSKLGRKFKMIAMLLTHRGITHTMYFVAMVYFLGIWANVPP